MNGLINLSTCLAVISLLTANCLKNNFTSIDNLNNKNEILAAQNDSKKSKARPALPSNEEIDMCEAFRIELEHLVEISKTYPDDSIEQDKICKLINKTEMYLERCQKEQNIDISKSSKHLEQNNNRGAIPLDPIAMGALAYFAANGHDLSYELLSHAFDSDVETGNSFYEPVNKHRIFQSDLTYKLAYDQYTNAEDFINNHPELIGSFIYQNENGGKMLVFPESSNKYENDLRNAIHAFNFRKPSVYSKEIIIEDRYDFEKGDYSGLEQYVINHLVDLQNSNFLKPFNLRISYDFSTFLQVKPISKSNNTWNLKVINHSSEVLKFVYNKKLCNYDDAKSWSNLIDISYESVNANSSKIITVQENILATTFALSILKGQKRYIIFGDKLESNLIDLKTKTISHSYNEMLSILGKNNGKWLVRFKNTTSYRALFEYNTKMCNYDDAKKWTGLLDLTDFYLSPGEERVSYIYENGFASSIAAAISGQYIHYCFYGDNLTLGGSINLRCESRNSAIRIENKGKVGNKWKIRVKNPTNANIKIFYNPKMCFEGDAKNWKGLPSNVPSVTISSYSYVDIQISENWFATHISISYLANNMRYVTYATELNVNKSIHIYWNVL